MFYVQSKVACQRANFTPPLVSWQSLFQVYFPLLCWKKQPKKKGGVSLLRWCNGVRLFNVNVECLPPLRLHNIYLYPKSYHVCKSDTSCMTNKSHIVTHRTNMLYSVSSQEYVPLRETVFFNTLTRLYPIGWTSAPNTNSIRLHKIAHLTSACTVHRPQIGQRCPAKQWLDVCSPLN